MDDKHGGGNRGSAAEELVLRTVAAHADSLLRTARRFSLCPDDAQDAYQRALEIFMGHADRLDPARAPGWLHVVVKREAHAIRRSRQKLVASSDIDLDAHAARSVPTPDEQLATFDLIGRSAEALQRLKPQELRALWLRAQGHSYNDIGAMTGWSYTKVNRCLTEGRRSFLERYAEIESGAECERWLSVISALVDGEATAEQMVELRPHLRNCPGCRATLRALQDSSQPLGAVLPIPLAVGATTGAADHVANLFTRAYEILVGGLHDRALTSFTKVQTVVEATAAGKTAAIAGAAAAVAGGGYATVERTMVEPPAERPAKTQRVKAMARPVKESASQHVVVKRRRTDAKVAPRVGEPTTRVEFRPAAKSTSERAAPEFSRHTASGTEVVSPEAPVGREPQAAPVAAPSPEFKSTASSSSPEFGP